MKTRAPINRYLPIKAFDHDGEMIRKFKSIHQFLRYANSNKYKLNSDQLKTLRNGELLRILKYLLGDSRKFQGSRVDPLSCTGMIKKSNASKLRNILKLKQFYAAQQLIVVVDGSLEIIGYSWGTMNKLAKQERVSVGTIKSSLHRSAKKFSPHGNPHTKHYVWLTDLPLFISHAEKSLCTR